MRNQRHGAVLRAVLGLRSSQHAAFDMRSARALAEWLIDERHHGRVDPSTYGLLTGLVVTYARPFTESRVLGRIGSKWSSFPDRPDLKGTMSD